MLHHSPQKVATTIRNRFKKKRKQNFIRGSVELHGEDGTKVDVKVDDNDIKAGSYQAT